MSKPYIIARPFSINDESKLNENFNDDDRFFTTLTSNEVVILKLKYNVQLRDYVDYIRVQWPDFSAINTILMLNELRP